MWQNTRFCYEISILRRRLQRRFLFDESFFEVFPILCRRDAGKPLELFVEICDVGKTGLTGDVGDGHIGKDQKGDGVVDFGCHEVRDHAAPGVFFEHAGEKSSVVADFTVVEDFPERQIKVLRIRQFADEGVQPGRRVLFFAYHIIYQNVDGLGNK